MKKTIAPLNKKRNSTIDLLKFVFSIVIVLHHSYLLEGVEKTHGIFLSGVSSIDFFFITAGFFMAATIVKNSTTPHIDGLGSETVLFLRKRISPIFPYVLFGFVTTLISRMLIQGSSYINSTHELLGTFWEISFLRMAGFKTTNVNNATWYLSAMFIAMFFLYPIVRKNLDLWMKALCPATAIMIYGYIIAEFSSLRQPSSFWCGVAYKGLLRAFAGLMLGIGIYALCQKFKSTKFKPLFMWFFSLTEWSCYALAIIIMFRFEKNYYDCFVILLFAIGITITCSGHSALSNKINFKFANTLGKFSTVLYLNHYLFTFITPAITSRFLPGASYQTIILIYFAISISWSSIVMLLVENFSKIHLFRKMIDKITITE